MKGKRLLPGACPAARRLSAPFFLIINVRDRPGTDTRTSIAVSKINHTCRFNTCRNRFDLLFSQQVSANKPAKTLSNYHYIERRFDTPWVAIERIRMPTSQIVLEFKRLAAAAIRIIHTAFRAKVGT